MDGYVAVHFFADNDKTEGVITSDSTFAFMDNLYVYSSTSDVFQPINLNLVLTHNWIENYSLIPSIYDL